MRSPRCPVPVPSWLADSGGKGIQIITVAHGEAQLRGRWGPNGARIIMDTSGAKLWLPGISDPETLDNATKLCGTTAMKETRTGLGRHHDHRDLYARHPVMTPEMIRQLPGQYALMVRGGMSPGCAPGSNRSTSPATDTSPQPLGPCWEQQHPLCLYGLDWLMELWSILHLTSTRGTPVLASQAEWQTRLLPALAEQMYIETSRYQTPRRPMPEDPQRPGRAQAHETDTWHRKARHSARCTSEVANLATRRGRGRPHRGRIYRPSRAMAAQSMGEASWEGAHESQAGTAQSVISPPVLQMALLDVLFL